MTLEPTSAPAFDPAIVSGVLHHMNDDHAADNLLIARAFGDRTALTARMTDLDRDGGDWVYATSAEPEVERTLRIAWSTRLSERAEIRREIVALYDRACAELGIAPRPHD